MTPADNPDRRMVAYIVDRATITAAQAGRPLRRWCGDDEHARLPQHIRDAAGRQVLDNLDAALAELADARAELAAALGPLAPRDDGDD
ncbi:hypothetical protein [Nocardia sp. NPDC004711]